MFGSRLPILPYDKRDPIITVADVHGFKLGRSGSRAIRTNLNPALNINWIRCVLNNGSQHQQLTIVLVLLDTFSSCPPLDVMS